MSFEKGVRRGAIWNDAKKIDEILRTHHFNTTGKNERDFENGLAAVLLSRKSEFNGQVITQIDKEKSVKSIYCFGKKYRPDMTIDKNSIAFELKFFNYAELKDAIGQGFLYRLQYKFVFLVLIISENRKEVYNDLVDGKEGDLENILQYLADKMNIFTYIAPAFSINNRIKSKFSYFKPLNS